MRRNSLTSSVASLYILQISNYLIPLITLPYLVRTLGGEYFGLISFAYSLTFFMVLLIDSGYNLIGLQKISTLGNAEIDRTHIRKYFWVTQIVKFFMAIVCFAVLCGCVFLIPGLRMHWPVYLLSYLTVLGSLFFPIWAFQGLEQMKFIAVLHISGRLISAVGIILFVKGPDDYIFATFLQSSATLFSGLLACPILFYKLKIHWLWPGVTEVWQDFLKGRQYFFSDFASTALANSSVFMLGLFQVNEIVGIFSAIEKLTRAMISGFAPIQRGFFPRVAKTYSESKSKGARMATKLIILIMIGALMMFMGTAIFSEMILKLTFGNKIASYSSILGIMGLWAAFSVSNTSLIEYVFVAQNKLTMLSRFQHVGSLVLLIGIPCSSYFGGDQALFGVACSMTISQALVFVLLLNYWLRDQQMESRLT